MHRLNDRPTSLFLAFANSTVNALLSDPAVHKLAIETPTIRLDFQVL
jgi:hypothetical protein